MDTAIRLTFDLGGVLSLTSLAVFLVAGARLIRDRSDPARPTATTTRAEAGEPSTRTVGDISLTF